MEHLHLEHPMHLWALLGIAVLYLLALPPRPRRVLMTAHWGPWERALARAGKRPARLRRWRFWLLVAAYALLVTAWSGPQYGGRPGPRQLVVVLDTSASMGAAGAGRGADLLSEAQRLVGTTSATLPDGVEVLRLGVGGELSLALAEAGPPVAPTGATGDLDRLVETLLSAVPDAQRAVWTVTDGRPGEGGSMPGRGALTVVGGEHHNGSLTAVALAERWPLPELEVTVRLQHHSGGTLRGHIEVEGAARRRDGEGPWAAPRELTPGAVHDLVVPLTRSPEGGELILRWRGEGDVLAIDDAVGWHLAPRPEPDIAILADEAEGTFAHLAGDVLAAESGGQVVAAGAGSVASLLVVDGGRMDLTAVPRALLFGTRPPAGAEDQASDLPWLDPVVVDWRRDHPLTAGLDLSELTVAEAWADAVPAAAEVLVWSDRGPLVAVRREGDRAWLHTAFRLGDSNLPLLAAFPQLLQRAYAAAWGAQGPSRPLDLGNKVPAGERELTPLALVDRPLPEFGQPGTDLGLWCLCGTALMLAVRLYT